MKDGNEKIGCEFAEVSKLPEEEPMWRWRTDVDVNVRPKDSEEKKEEGEDDDDVIHVLDKPSFLRLGCIFWEGDEEDCDPREKMENTISFWSNLVGLTEWLPPTEAAAQTHNSSYSSLSIG